MFKNNNNKEFVLVKIDVMGTLEMLSKDNVFCLLAGCQTVSLGS